MFPSQVKRGQNLLKSRLASPTGFRRDDPEFALEIACRAEQNNLLALKLGLPQRGAEQTNQFGLQFTVEGHAFLPTAETIFRWRAGEVEQPEDLFPVVAISNLSKRLSDFLAAVDRSTTRTIVIVDTVPGVRPKGVPGHHYMDTAIRAESIVIHVDAARLHETILAHEIGHAWVQYIEGCEDLRVMRDCADPLRLHQLSFIQSFVLDLKVNEILRAKDFDMTPIDSDLTGTVRDLAKLDAMGFIAQTKREELFHSLQIAALMVERDRGNIPGLVRFDDDLAVIQSKTPELFAVADGMARAVLDLGLGTKDAIRLAIDECLRLGFEFTGDPLEIESDLVNPGTEEPNFDKYPEWIPGAFPQVKALIGRAMARESIPSESRWCLVDAGAHALLSFELPDGSVRGPWPIPHPFADWLHRHTMCEVLKMNQVARERQEKLMYDTKRMNEESMRRHAEELARLSGQAVPKVPGSISIPGQSSFPGAFAGRRPYMGGLGRFATQARLREILEGEQPYAYAMCNPTTYVDPQGLQPRPRGGGPRTGKCAIFICYQYGFGFPGPPPGIPTHEYVCVTGPHGGCAGGLYPGNDVGDANMPCESRHEPFPIHCDEITNRSEEKNKCEMANAVCECIRIRRKDPPSYWGVGTCMGFAKNVLGCALDRLSGDAKADMMSVILYRA